MRSLRLLLFPLIFCSIAIPLRAQHNGYIRGRLVDTSAGQLISDATITLLDARDSSLISFTRSTAGGSFVVGGLGTGRYKLQISHVGYTPVIKDLTLTATIRDIDLGRIVMTDKAAQLAAATVEATPPPVSIHGDSIEYNAGSFKTKPDAVVEDLLKKLPGIEVSKDGKIKANGVEVKKILVDGKEFFGNDPQIATKNLPADAVDKVQVFDKKSDQARFTGFDDGNSERTINLTIKKDRKHGIFGKAMAGYGIDALDKDKRYDSKANLNQFSGDYQLSGIGMANNINKQGFTFQDLSGFGNGSGPGGGGGSNGALNPDVFNGGVPLQDLLGNSRYITTTTAGGANFNDSWRHHTDVNGNYFYNGTVDHIDEHDARQNLLPGNAFIQDQSITGERHNQNQRLTAIIDQQLDSFNSVKLTSSLITQNSHRQTSAIDTSRNMSPDSLLLNDGLSRSVAWSRAYSWNTSALLRHKFAAKGRTLSALLSYGSNNSMGGGSLYSINHFAAPAVAADTIDQTYWQTGNGNSYGVNLVYTEPLSRHSLFEFNYNYYYSHSLADKTTMNADGSGKYDLPDTALTNDFKNTWSYDQEGLQYLYNRKNWNFTVGASLQQAFANHRFGYLDGDSSIRQTWNNVLPRANIEYKFNGYHNLHVSYYTYINPPALSQLAPVPDNSDPLNIKAGNPALKPEYYHSVRLNYMTGDPFRHTSFFGILGYTGIHNSIVNDEHIDSSGVTTIRPVNLKGLFRTNGQGFWEFPWRDLHSHITVSSSVSYEHSASLVNDRRNNSGNWVLSQGADLNYTYKDILDITAGARATYYDTRFSLAANQNQSYWLGDLTLDATWYLPDGLTLASDLEFVHRTGLPPGLNGNPLVWNAGIAKQLFRNRRGGIRLQVFDILRQNTGVTRNTDQNYIDDISYKVLKQYFLLSFTYSINRFAGKAIKASGKHEQKPDIRIFN